MPLALGETTRRRTAANSARSEKVLEKKRMQDDQDVVREFLVESHENLSRLDRDLIELERCPQDSELLASVFRTIHTIKGTCGFFAFTILEKITHQAETLLSQLREGKRELNPSLVSLILETVDATRKVLASIEATGKEGPDLYEELTERLRAEANLLDANRSEPAPRDLPGASAEQPAKSCGRDHQEGTKPEDEGARSSAVVDANIRVGVVHLDKLMDLVGELVLTRNQILQFNAEREDPALNATSQRLNLITTELQEGVMKTRMQPIGMVWNKLPRVVRDMAVSFGKQIRLEMDGADTELDRTIIEAIKDPLVHLVRNACDHGIELPSVRTAANKSPQGTLTLRAYHEGGQVNIEIGDDGAGIDVLEVRQKAIENGLLRPEQAEKMTDREALNLIFQAGFSTAKSITKISGRGVGMDVVRSNIEKIGGVVDICNRPGEGATIKLKIPLTLAIIPGLVITSGGERFVIPQVSLLELIRIEGESSEKHIEQIHGTPVYRRRGNLLPIAYLNRVLALQSKERNEAVSIVVLQAEDRQFGLVVDGINDTQEIVVKPLGKQLKGLTEYAGATIMGDGRVALILDVLGIGLRSGVLAECRDQARTGEEKKAHSAVEKQRLLLFRAGSFDRLAVPLSLVARLEEFPLSSIEFAGGSQVVQYRNRLLPLVALDKILDSHAPTLELPQDPVQVIVFNDGDRIVGVVVSQILDVVEDSLKASKTSSHKGLLGSAVVGGRVTDLLDLNEIIHAASETWFQGLGGSGCGKKVLVAESSPFSRGLLRSELDLAGYEVREAGDFDEAMRAMEREPADVVLAAIDLPPKGSSALVAAMRLRPDWDRIPVMGLADSSAQIRSAAFSAAVFDDCQVKFDGKAVLESVARLASVDKQIQIQPACVGEEK